MIDYKLNINEILKIQSLSSFLNTVPAVQVHSFIAKHAQAKIIFHHPHYLQTP